MPVLPFAASDRRGSIAGRVSARTAARVAELLARESRLTLFAVVLLVATIPMAMAAGLDDRTLRGADVWIKPIKFALSIAVVALTTATFIGHLPPAHRRGPAIDRIVWIVIGAGTFEFVYIALQASLGQASHYNGTDAFHIAIYALMGVGALALTATQPMLAWQLVRHPDPARPIVQRRVVVLGLVLTFVLGAGIGIVLAARQPPTGGAVVPLLGWSLVPGDLRPAHFVGIHAEQLLPLAAWIATVRRPRSAGVVAIGIVAGYCALFALLAAYGLEDA